MLQLRRPHICLWHCCDMPSLCPSLISLHTSASFRNSLRMVPCGTLILGCLKNVSAIQCAEATWYNWKSLGIMCVNVLLLMVKITNKCKFFFYEPGVKVSSSHFTNDCQQVTSSLKNLVSLFVKL